MAVGMNIDIASIDMVSEVNMVGVKCDSFGFGVMCMLGCEVGSRAAASPHLNSQHTRTDALARARASRRGFDTTRGRASRGRLDARSADVVQGERCPLKEKGSRTSSLKVQT